jgi:hypothetical protein
MYDMRPDREGWTVYEIGSQRPAALEDLPLVGLEYEVADELVGLLNRSGQPRRPKRLSNWPLASTMIASKRCPGR